MENLTINLDNPPLDYNVVNKLNFQVIINIYYVSNFTHTILLKYFTIKVDWSQIVKDSKDG